MSQGARSSGTSAGAPAEVLEVGTPVGPARAHVAYPDHDADKTAGTLVLGHGAGGGINAPDLERLLQLAEDGWTVIRVEQPWRVAGRRMAGPAPQLDTAWLAVMRELTEKGPAVRPLVTGGRSSGARVACRTAEAVDVDAVLALSFPLHPPGRPEKSRAAEAAQVLQAGIPLGVVQGMTDPWGTPQEIRAALGTGVTVLAVQGGHSFTRRAADVLPAAREWLARTLGWSAPG